MSKTDESPTRGFQIYLCDKDGKVKSAARFVAIVMGGKGTLILRVVEFRYLCNAITKYQKSATGDLRTRRFRLYDCDRDSKENSTARNMVHFVAIGNERQGDGDPQQCRAPVPVQCHSPVPDAWAQG